MPQDPTATDPQIHQIELRAALGRAYSAVYSASRPSSAVTDELRTFLADNPAVAGIAPQYRVALAQTVSGRTIGQRCGCHISKAQLDLLTGALTGTAHG